MKVEMNQTAQKLAKYFGGILTALIIAPFALLGLVGIFTGIVIKSFSLVLLADPDAALEELRQTSLVN